MTCAALRPCSSATRAARMASISGAASNRTGSVQGNAVSRSALAMAAFAAGVATIILALAYGARAWLARNRARMMRLAQASRPVMGAVFLATGAALWFGLHHRLEAAMLGLLPEWFLNLSISI